MEFAPIALPCLLAAALIIARPNQLGLPVFAIFLPLQTAAIINLPAVGGMSIIAAHFLIGAMVLGVALRPKAALHALEWGAEKPAVILLLLFALYAVFSAFMMPRLFQGEVAVFSMERNTEGRIFLSSLQPTSGNISQSIYIIANSILFAVAAFLFSRRGGLRRATHAVNVLTGVHIFFGLLSAAPNFAPVGAVLDFVRTANYAILDHHQVAGAPRLIGSYAEPSAFGVLTSSIFAWNFVRFMQTRGLWYFIASLALLAQAAMSLSSTAYATIIILIGFWGLHSIYHIVRRGIASDQVTALLFVGVLVAAAIALLLAEPIQAFGMTVYERLFSTKLASDSGVERMTWNAQSLQNVIDTNGLGVGLGSARASSLLTVLPGNVGVLGAGLYVAFLFMSFLRVWPRKPASEDLGHVAYSRRIFTAARAAALAVLVAQIVSGGLIDPGLIFIVFASLATAAYLPAARRSADFDIAPTSGLSLRGHFPARGRVFLGPGTTS